MTSIINIWWRCISKRVNLLKLLLLLLLLNILSQPFSALLTLFTKHYYKTLFTELAKIYRPTHPWGCRLHVRVPTSNIAVQWIFGEMGLEGSLLRPLKKILTESKQILRQHEWHYQLISNAHGRNQMRDFGGVGAGLGLATIKISCATNLAKFLYSKNK